MEFKGTKGERSVIERDEWFDVVDENNDRITSFDKSDDRSLYDAVLDAHALEMLEMLMRIHGLVEHFPEWDDEAKKILALIKSATTE